MMWKRVIIFVVIVNSVVFANFMYRLISQTKFTKNPGSSSGRTAVVENDTAGTSTGEIKKRNRLANEKSPYLQQHADNPVDWYPWGQEAFEKAKREDKPIFLSIGYSTCHWCHVMEQESFENSEIAEMLNTKFVPIKVDREERPDIDNIYMPAVILLSGTGGWPVSLFLTPNKEPFAGGTYFPPQNKWGIPGFKEMLAALAQLWTNEREKTLNASKVLTQALQDRFSSTHEKNDQKISPELLKQTYDQFSSRYDTKNGGFDQAPKFPAGHNLSFLLRYWKRSGDTKALDMVEKTLTEMAKGGIYDHLGGGFHRYSTDPSWQIPHFEKMLYDQAILAKTYLEAYQATGKEQYADVTREIFDYVLRDMRDKQGAFYSAEDADSLPPEKYMLMSPDPAQKHQKKEGAFYMWTAEEILNILGKEDADVFNFYFGIEEKGNAPANPQGEIVGKNILHTAYDLKTTAQQFNKSEEEILKTLQEAKQKLFFVRSQRPRPHRDDKILTDWNGLMIASLAQGGRVLKEPLYLQAAEQASRFLLQNLADSEGRLLHRYRDGESAILGTLEDYAFFIQALLELYESTFKIGYLKEAQRLTAEMIRLFWDNEQGGFFFTGHDAEKLFVRQKLIYDGATPSGNSVAALDLLKLARLTFVKDWESKVEKLVQFFAEEVTRGPSNYAQFMMALDFAFGPSYEIVIAGDRQWPLTQQMIDILNSHFVPNKVVAHRPVSQEEAEPIIELLPFIKEQKAIEDKTTVYVCQNHVCKLPTSDIEEFKQLLGLTKETTNPKSPEIENPPTP